MRVMRKLHPLQPTSVALMSLQHIQIATWTTMMFQTGLLFTRKRSITMRTSMKAKKSIMMTNTRKRAAS